MRRTPIVAGTFQIVVLCGSKGALPAYIKILRMMPHKSGMAFVVLTHRRTGQPCFLTQILATATKLPVEEIRDGSAVLPDRVYVIPPGRNLSTDGTVFRLTAISKVYGWPDQFNIFLRSLARNTRDRAVTIILSGMGDDGSAALEELRLSGGLIFAQADAEVRSLAASAVATGKVDYLCSTAQIGTLVSLLPSISGKRKPVPAKRQLLSNKTHS